MTIFYKGTLGGCARSSLTPGFRAWTRAAGAPQGEVGGLFFVCCLYSVDVIKSAKGAYLEISSSSKHICNILNEMQYM